MFVMALDSVGTPALLPRGEGSVGVVGKAGLAEKVFAEDIRQSGPVGDILCCCWLVRWLGCNDTRWVPEGSIPALALLDGDLVELLGCLVESNVSVATALEKIPDSTPGDEAPCVPRLLEDVVEPELPRLLGDLAGSLVTSPETPVDVRDTELEEKLSYPVVLLIDTVAIGTLE